MLFLLKIPWKNLFVTPPGPKDFFVEKFQITDSISLINMELPKLLISYKFLQTFFLRICPFHLNFYLLWHKVIFKILLKVKVKLLSHVRLFATPWTVAYQAPPSLGFSRQEYWSGLPLPFPGDLSNPGIEPRSPTL